MGALVALALLASIRRAPLFCLPLLDDVAERLGAFRGFLPTLPLCISLGLRAFHDRLLLANRLGQPRQESLVIAQVRCTDAAAGALLELLLVVAA